MHEALRALDAALRALHQHLADAPWAFSDAPRRPPSVPDTLLFCTYEEEEDTWPGLLLIFTDRWLREHRWLLPLTADPAVPTLTEADHARALRWLTRIARWLARWEARAADHAARARAEPAYAHIRARVAAHQLAGCCVLAHAPALAPFTALLCDLRARVQPRESGRLPLALPDGPGECTYTTLPIPFALLRRTGQAQTIPLTLFARWRGWYAPRWRFTTWTEVLTLWDALLQAPVNPL